MNCGIASIITLVIYLKSRLPTKVWLVQLSLKVLPTYKSNTIWLTLVIN